MIKVTYTPEFKKELKRLSKKFISLDSDVRALLDEIAKNPTLGKPLGGNVFKIRLGVKSKGRGKSGGARIISYFYSSGDKVYLLYIYDKSEYQSISTKEIKALLKSLTD